MGTLGEICCKIGSGATPKGGKECYVNVGTSFIRSMNVLNLKFIIFILIQNYIVLPCNKLFQGDCLCIGTPNPTVRMKMISNARICFLRIKKWLSNFRSLYLPIVITACLLFFPHSLCILPSVFFYKNIYEG